MDEMRQDMLEENANGYEVYVISHYGERLGSRHINVDFLLCENVDRYISEDNVTFWNRVGYIAAEIPTSIYREFFDKSQRTLYGHEIFKAVIERTTSDRGIFCEIKEFGRNVFNAYIRIISAKRHDDASILSFLRRKYSYESEINELDDSELLRRLAFDPEQKYLFKVNNVGQGLATSIQRDDEPPFFYFDYGCGAPNSTAVLGVNRDSVIVLSHVDIDHWCAERNNPASHGCWWIVPLQNAQAPFLTLLSSLVTGGTKVNWYNSDIDLAPLHIGHSTDSSITTGRVPKTVHETGFALYISAKISTTDEFTEYKITVSGDQDYDYQHSRDYEESDLLVACHHGGKYCWSRKFGGIHPKADESIVVYSAGNHKRFKHPSKRKDYKKWGWKKEWLTKKNGEFVKEIYF